MDQAAVDDPAKTATRMLPTNQTGNNRHPMAFDRIFLCDYMFGFVDCFFHNLLYNKALIDELRSEDGWDPDDETEKNSLLRSSMYVADGRAGFSHTYAYRDIMQNHYRLHMSQRTAALFKCLSVCIEMFKNGQLVITLAIINAMDTGPRVGAGYIYSILQGVKMGVIMHHSNMKHVHRNIMEGVPSAQSIKSIDTVIRVNTPDSETTHQYLQKRENHPPDYAFKTYDGARDAGNYGNSFEMRLRKNKEGGCWYWNVNTLQDVLEDDSVQQVTKGVHKPTAAMESSKGAPEGFSRASSRGSDTDPNDDSTDTRTIQGRSDWYRETMAAYNSAMSNQVQGLIPYDSSKLIFCTESLAGISIARELATVIWTHFVKPELDACMRVQVEYEIEGENDTRKWLKATVHKAAESKCTKCTTHSNNQLKKQSALVHAVLKSIKCSATYTRCVLYPSMPSNTYKYA